VGLAVEGAVVGAVGRPVVGLLVVGALVVGLLVVGLLVVGFTVVGWLPQSLEILCRSRIEESN
jgi:hypothetical protein